MADRWELFRRLWNVSDQEPPITDPSTAEDSLVEDLIIRVQEIFKETTDKLAALSAMRTGNDDNVRNLHDSVILAYAAALSGDLEEVKKILKRVV